MILGLFIIVALLITAAVYWFALAVVSSKSVAETPTLEWQWWAIAGPPTHPFTEVPRCPTCGHGSADWHRRDTLQRSYIALRCVRCKGVWAMEARA